MRSRDLCLALALLVAPLAAGEADAVARARAASRDLAALLAGSFVFVADGSGVMISADGLLLTCHHVAGGIERLRVRLASGETAQARRLGSEPLGDLALFRLEPDEGETALPAFRHVDLATDADLLPLIPVWAIGDPFSLGDVDGVPAVSAGVLAAVGAVRGVYTDCLVLDAPVNPGNSGGPLLDAHGRLLGINGQIRTRTGLRANSGIGLAISARQIRAFLPVLAAAEGGLVHRTALPPGLELAEDADGVVVKGWSPADPALAAAVAPGDRVLAVAGRAVASRHAAEGCAASAPWAAGCTLTLRLRRGGAEREVVLPSGRSTIPGRPGHGLSWAAATVVESDGASGGKVRQERLKITTVAPDSPAAKAGLAVGDLLLEIAGRPLAKPLDAVRALRGLEIGDRVALRWRRQGGEERTAVIQLLAQP